MKPLIVANWKCNPHTLREAKQLFESVKKRVKNIKKAEVVICPPSVYLSGLKPQGLSFKIGAQNCFWEKKGAYTGEVSPAMLKSSGCQYVIIGHSERRRYFNETDETVNKKIKSVLEEKLNPVLCIGETQEQRNKEETDHILKRQIEAALEKISQSKFSKVTIAYEPIWAIGTGKPCDIEEAQKMGLLIRKIVSRLYGSKSAKNVQVLYGGSVNSKNAAGYIKEAGLQGLLIGGASLKAKEFIQIVKAVI